MLADLSHLQVPGPTITATSAPFWDAVKNDRLLLQHCEDCLCYVFYPRSICPHCWSAHLTWKDAVGTGTLKSYSIVHKPGHSAWEIAVPYIVGLVRLAEGPTMLSLILPPEVPIGSELVMTPTNIAGRILPAFRSKQ